MLGNSILEVGGRRYAVGLRWVPSQDVAIKKAAKAGAARRKADFYVVRPPVGGQLGQYGLGQRSQGHRVGMPSAAAILVANNLGSWVGAWKTKAGWWLVVVREGLIESDGDVLFATEEGAQARFEEEMARGGLDRYFAPASWEIVGSEGTQLPIMLSGGGRAHRLVAAGGRNRRALLLACAGAALVGGVWFATKKEVPKDIPKLTTSVPKIDRETQVARLAVWKNRPRADAWGMACLAIVDKLPWVQTGWALGGLVCGESSVSVAWVRRPGPAVMPAGARVDPSGKSASQDIPLGSAPSRGEEALLSQAAVTQVLLASPLRPEMSSLPDDLISEVVGTEEKKVPAPWAKRKINVKLPRWPTPALDELSRIQGLVVNGMKMGQNGWDLEATIYEARDQ